MLETSIIIRTKNEEQFIGEVLRRLSNQTYKDFEVIIIDSGSTDKTLEIASDFKFVKIFKIKPEEFSYPFALNFGCAQASAAKYFVFISGHSLPPTKTWLEDGLKNFIDDKIMGGYGFVWAIPGSGSSIWEKIFFNKYICKFRNLFKKRIIVKNGGMGVMGNTNAIIRRDLWDKHHFSEAYGMGGEDGEWSEYWFKNGYVAIRDIKFSVYHSHKLNLKQLKQQYRHWVSVDKPQPFKFQDYRKK